LLELLVTLVVLGLLLVTLTQGIRVGLRAWAIEGHLSLQSGGLDTTDRTLRQLLERASPREPTSRNGNFIGTAHRLSFTTTLPGGYGAPMTHEADVTLLVTERHQLELLWRPHYRRWIVPLPPPSTNVLVDDVDRLDLEFWQPPRTLQQPGGWLSTWSAREPPLLVRLRVVFPPGDARHWPDIVIAPMRTA
jgi:general secretion pathway protein J